MVIQVNSINISLEDSADKAVSIALDVGCHYCDVRAEKISKNWLLIENGEVEHSNDNLHLTQLKLLYLQNLLNSC